LANSSWIGPGFTLAVAEMQPTPPLRMLSSSISSWPAKMPKPGKASNMALVLFQSPEESFAPAMMPG